MLAMSYISSYFHCVFSTKERRPLLQPEWRDRLWPFLSGIARQNQMKAIEIGGIDWATPVSWFEPKGGYAGSARRRLP